MHTDDDNGHNCYDYGGGDGSNETVYSEHGPRCVRGHSKIINDQLNGANPAQHTDAHVKIIHECTQHFATHLLGALAHPNRSNSGELE